MALLKHRRFAGTPYNLGPLHPFIGAPTLPRGGVLLGPSTETGAMVRFNPWLLRKLDIITSTVFLILGDKGAGKSTLMKVLFLRLMGLQAGRDTNGHPRRMRGRMNDRRMLFNGKPEYSSIADALGGKVVNLNQEGLINPFDPLLKLERRDMVAVAIHLCELANEGPLTALQRYAAAVAVDTMLRESNKQHNVGRTAQLSMTLDYNDMRIYHHSLNRSEDMSSMEDVQLNISEADFRQASGQVGALLSDLQGGGFGNVIGEGTSSLRELLAGRTVDLNWNGVPDKAVTLLESLLWMLQSKGNEEDYHDIIPHINISDEEHKMVGNLTHMRSRLEYMRLARTYPTLDFVGTQFESDLTMAGDPDSEIRRVGEAISKSFGGRFIGKQPPEEEDKLQHFINLGLSDLQAASLTSLERGEFILLIQGHPPIPFQLIITPIEAELAYTEGVSEEYSGTIPVWEYEQILEQERKFGTMTVGGEA